MSCSHADKAETAQEHSAALLLVPLIFREGLASCHLGRGLDVEPCPSHARVDQIDGICRFLHLETLGI